MSPAVELSYLNNGCYLNALISMIIIVCPTTAAIHCGDSREVDEWRLWSLIELANKHTGLNRP